MYKSDVRCRRDGEENMHIVMIYTNDPDRPEIQLFRETWH